MHDLLGPTITQLFNRGDAEARAVNTSWGEGDIPDQRGRVALVTGANSGIGFETARALAARGARVLLGCRDRARGEEARRRIEAVATDAQVCVIPLDLASLRSIHDAAQEVSSRCDALDLLVNNAGVMALPRRTTADGFELQLGTNHLGHFALTGHLLPLLLRAPDARVVTVSSTLHKVGRVDFDDLQGERGYDRWRRYSQSKVANLLFTFELQRRLAAAGTSVIALACHPGAAATALAREAGPLHDLVEPLFRLWIQTAAMGALPTLRAATDPDARGGEYFGPSGLGELRGAPTRVTASAYSRRADVAARLWTVSAQRTGVTPAFA